MVPISDFFWLLLLGGSAFWFARTAFRNAGKLMKWLHLQAAVTALTAHEGRDEDNEIEIYYAPTVSYAVDGRDYSKYLDDRYPKGALSVGDLLDIMVNPEHPEVCQINLPVFSLIWPALAAIILFVVFLIGARSVLFRLLWGYG